MAYGIPCHAQHATCFGTGRIGKAISDSLYAAEGNSSLFWAAALVALVFFMFRADPASAQTLTLTPDCGLPGSTSIQVTGKGWQPQGPQYCVGGEQYYQFLLDGQEFARQWIFTGLGTKEQPNTTFVIPANAVVGTHTVRVVLWSHIVFFGWWPLQCREIDLCVVETVNTQPWSYNVDDWPLDPQIAKPVLSIFIHFDPKEVCDVPPCQKIGYVQIMQVMGRDEAGQWRVLTPSGVKHPAARKLDPLLTDTGWQIDWDPDKMAEQGPFYPMKAHGKKQCRKDKKAWAVDGVTHGDYHYPAGIDRILKNFKTYAYCMEGAQAGRFLGHVEWYWTRDKNTPPNLYGWPVGQYSPPGYWEPSLSGPEEGGPLEKALEKWNSVRRQHPLPSETPEEDGGRPCGGFFTVFP